MNNSFIILISLFLFYVLFICNLEKVSNIIDIFDIPNKRKLHKKKTPLLGGLIFYIFVIFFFLIGIFYNEQNFFIVNFNLNREIFSFYGIFTFIFILGLIDDKKNLTPSIKTYVIIILILAALLINENLIINRIDFFSLNKAVFLKSFGLMFTTFSIFIFMNAFNMFDGINVQSGLYVLFITIIFIFKGLSYNFFYFFLIPCFVFLYLNYKGKIFLGNSGSYSLSYLFSYVIIHYVNESTRFSAEEIFLIMAIPGLEVIRLFFKRILQGRSPFVADNNHIHHILLDMFSPKITVLIIFSLTVIPVICSLYFKIYIVPIIFQLIAYFFFIIKYQK